MLKLIREHSISNHSYSTSVYLEFPSPQHRLTSITCARLSFVMFMVLSFTTLGRDVLMKGLTLNVRLSSPSTCRIKRYIDHA